MLRSAPVGRGMGARGAEHASVAYSGLSLRLPACTACPFADLPSLFLPTLLSESDTAVFCGSLTPRPPCREPPLHGFFWDSIHDFLG